MFVAASIPAAAGISTVTGPSVVGVTTIVYTVELTALKLQVDALVTLKSPPVTQVTGSLNVAVTVNAAFVGFEAGVERTTVGALVSTVNEVTASGVLGLLAPSVTVIVQAA